MFRSFTFTNFRCFRDLRLDSLARVNLIAGQNNVGKTALLEGIFLSLGPNNPELSIRINVWRGFQRFGPHAEDVWDSLFFDLDTDDTIEIVAEDVQASKSVFRMSLAEPETAQLIGPESENGGTGVSTTSLPDTRQLKLEYQVGQEQPAVSWATPAVEGRERRIRGKSAQIAQLTPGVFISTLNPDPQENADRFSELARTKRQNEMVNVLRILEPRLQSLEVQSVSRMPIIFGDVGLSELLPLPMMGQGIVRLLSIMLAINTTTTGVVLIDEIENGLHYSVMAKVWAAIAQAARAADVQIFATTHSWECITAAHEAFSSSETYDFRLHRLDRVGEDIQAVTLDQEMLDTAIKAGLEVR